MRYLVILFLLVPISASANDAIKEAMERATERLTVSYQCAAITGDRAAYASAKAATPKILESAGITAISADELIALVESQDQIEEEGLTVALCSELIGQLE